jgi:2-succinyl-6-hydroxy-2,4-cyclohexadiene-1-carboxylate synthase
VLHIDVHGRGPRLVLVHGLTQTRRSWEPLLAPLAARHQVVCVDAPGHGLSARYRVGLWEGARLLGEVGGRASYLGYSLGGRLCLHLALAAPYLVRRLVLVGASPGIEDEAEREVRRRADEELAATLERDGLDAFLRSWLAGPLFAGLTPEAAGLDARRENTVPGLAASLRLAGTGVQEPLWGRLHRLAMPVLVVAGERDERFVTVARRAAAAIGDNATLALVPGAGHAAHLERPDAFLEVVEPFLAPDADDEAGRGHARITPDASRAP